MRPASGRLALCLAILLVGPVGPARADEAEVRCVEGQLHAAGHLAREPVGLVDAELAQALDGFVGATGIAPGRPLAPWTAATWCRRIGETDPPLRRFWPWDGRSLDLHIAADVPAEVADWLHANAARIYRRVTALAGRDLAGRDVLVVGSATAPMTEALADAGIARLSLPFRVQRFCRGDDETRGTAFSGLGIVCMRQPARLGYNFLARALTETIAHESMHLVQFQLAGEAPPLLFGQARVDALSPMWLLEGYAELVGLTHAYLISPPEVRRALVRGWGPRPLPPLETMLRQDINRPDVADVYRAGAIAAALLVESRGHAAVTGLYARMGEGQGFADAFAEMFGESVETFYGDFARRARQGTKD